MSSSLEHIISVALDHYAKQTGINLSDNPFAEKLQPAESPDAILQLLQERGEAFKEYRNENQSLASNLSRIVGVLHAFSLSLDKTSIPLLFSLSNAIFVGIDNLLAAASGASSSYDALIELFECVGSFLRRLGIYTHMPPTPMMTDLVVKIMVELLSILALATKQIKQGRLKKFAKKLLQESEVEAVMQRLDRMTQEEARNTVVQTLDVVHGLVSNVKVVIDDGRASTDGIRQSLVALHQISSEINKMKRDQLQRDVQRWLSPPDPSANHHMFWKAHHRGTAEWFFNSNIFNEWKTTGSLLWVRGNPGSGKSTLLSAIIQDVGRMCAAGLATMAYFYFDFRDSKKQDLYGLLSSFLSQLSAESDSYYNLLSKLYSDYAGGTRKPPNRALIASMKEMLRLPGQGDIYIVIDALDECPDTSGVPSTRQEVVELVEELVVLNLSNVRVCVSSRPETDIRMVLAPLTSHQLSLHDEEGQKEDIISYIKSVVYSDWRMRRWREEDKQLTIDILSDKAGGMFRWVICQFDRLRRSFPASIRSVLNDFPESLDETYAHILLGIGAEKRKYALRLFQCLMVSIRPLHVQEIADILAVHFDGGSLPTFNVDWQPMDAEEAVLSACSSLISIVDVADSKIIQFSHFSVKEYLKSERLATSEERLSYYHILPEPAHTVLALASLSVLLKLDYKIDRNAIRHFPLAFYAAQYWVDHAQHSDASSHIQEAMECLFDPAKSHFAAWVWIYDIDRPWLGRMAGFHPTQPPAGPLYYASSCGLRGLVEHLLIAKSQDINSRGGSHTTPLHTASIRGHLEVTSLLLKRGADVNTRDHRGRTPLHRVSQGGHSFIIQSALEIARLLIETGANVNVPDDRGWTPLHLAAQGGHRGIVELLLTSGASPAARNKGQETPLATACGNGILEVSRILIDHGSDLNSRDTNDFTPLHSASGYGHVDVVRLLLDHGADMNVRSKHCWTPLHHASRCGHLEVARLLLAYGADANAQEADGWTPLHHASRYEHLGMARLLMDHGADVNVFKADGWTPLHLASGSGHINTVKLLIEHGASIDNTNNNQETPFYRASRNGYLEIARMLLEHGAIVSSRDREGWTPFHTASQSGHLHVAKFLLGNGIDIDIRSESEETALHLASGSGKIDVVRFLIDHGADIHAKDRKGWHPLHVASLNGHSDVVHLLIDVGVAVDIRNGTRKTPLALASSQGKVQVSHLLVDRGADINARDNRRWTPLHFASRYGHLAMARLLLDHGVDPNVQEEDLWSPLHLASANGHLKVSMLLLERGAEVDVFSVQRQTPLDRAARNGNVEVARVLIDHGANLQATESSGLTPLHSASQFGQLDVVQLLLGRGADVDALDTVNRTAADLALENDEVDVANFLAQFKADANIRNKLRATTSNPAYHKADEDEESALFFTASEEGNFDIVKSLLEQGIDIDIRNANFETTLQRAAFKGNLEIVQLLVERGAEVDSHDDLGWTPLHNASRFGHVEVSRALLDYGANVNARQQHHQTPIHLAAGNGHIEVVELLLKHGAEINALNDEGQNPYQLSVRRGYQNIAQVLESMMRAEYDT